jgi:uncharacterized protein RhaS with RHS repeats
MVQTGEQRQQGNVTMLAQMSGPPAAPELVAIFWETDVPSHYRARYYDPNSGHFLSEDPAGFDAGVNFYSYVDNDPANYEDPLGLQRYKCPLFGPCRHLTKKEQKRALCCAQRPPDFYNLSVSGGEAWGPTLSFSVDRHGNAYIGAGIQAGKAPTLVGASLTANHLDSCRPTGKELDSYLSGANVSVTGAFGVAVQQGVSPTNATSPAGWATGYGVGTPQAGASVTDSIPLNAGTVIKILRILSGLLP